MDQIPVKTHKSNDADKTAQFNLETVKIIKLSWALYPWFVAGDWDARVVLSDRDRDAGMISVVTLPGHKYPPPPLPHSARHNQLEIRHGNQVRWGRDSGDNVTYVTWHVTRCHEPCHDSSHLVTTRPPLTGPGATSLTRFKARAGADTDNEATRILFLMMIMSTHRAVSSGSHAIQINPLQLWDHQLCRRGSRPIIKMETLHLIIVKTSLSCSAESGDAEEPSPAKRLITDYWEVFEFIAQQFTR